MPWATIYGKQPQVMICALLPDELEAEQRMAKTEWSELLERLQKFIENFECKLVPGQTGISVLRFFKIREMSDCRIN